MNTITIIILIILGFICLKWILLPFMCIFWWMDSIYYKTGKKYKILRVPNWLIEKLIGGNGGVFRFYTYQLGHLSSIDIRKLIYKIMGVNMGKHCTFHYGTQIRSPFYLSLGNGCIIGDNAMLDARNKLSLGDNVVLASNVSIYTMQHNHRDPNFGVKFENRDCSVTIGNRAWLGANVIILPGVTIGEGAVCCAGSVVTKDVPPFTVVGGIPAKKVNERPRNMTYNFSHTSCNFY